jgi:hypothetical protein
MHRHYVLLHAPKCGSRRPGRMQAGVGGKSDCRTAKHRLVPRTWLFPPPAPELLGFPFTVWARWASSMQNEALIQLIGTVTEALPASLVPCRPAQRPRRDGPSFRQAAAQLRPASASAAGDKVQVELTPFDLARGETPLPNGLSRRS